MDNTIQLALIVVGALTVVITAGIIVLGLYLMQARHDQELNFRESLRMQKAIAVAQAEAGVSGEGDGLMGLIAQAAPLLQQFAAAKGMAPQEPEEPQKVN